jgi:hypothetical protein
MDSSNDEVDFTARSDKENVEEYIITPLSPNFPNLKKMTSQKTHLWELCRECIII